MLPAVPTADPSAYDWINQELGWFGVAACVTVATDATREQLAAAFGVDLSSPQPGILPLRQARASSANRPRSPYDPPLVPPEEPRMVSLTTIQGRQVAIEVNDFVGTQRRVVETASMRGRAANAFWNVNAKVTFGCAVDGRLLYSGEFAYVHERPGLPKELSPLADLVAVDLEDYEDDLAEDRPPQNTVALAMLETFTGVRLTAYETKSALQQGYLLQR
jgi:Family of unknown function (DUF6461)